MPPLSQTPLFRLRTQADWAVLFCRGLILFIIQGAGVLVSHAVVGWTTPKDLFPLGLRLDPLHGVVHLVTGIIAATIGFAAQGAAAVRFTQAFGVFYLLLAAFGTFTKIHFGLELGFNENAIHWVLGGWSAVIGFGPLIFGGRGRLPRWGAGQ